MRWGKRNSVCERLAQRTVSTHVHRLIIEVCARRSRDGRDLTGGLRGLEKQVLHRNHGSSCAIFFRQERTLMSLRNWWGAALPSDEAALPVECFLLSSDPRARSSTTVVSGSPTLGPRLHWPQGFGHSHRSNASPVLGCMGSELLQGPH